MLSASTPSVDSEGGAYTSDTREPPEDAGSPLLVGGDGKPNFIEVLPFSAPDCGNEDESDGQASSRDMLGERLGVARVVPENQNDGAILLIALLAGASFWLAVLFVADDLTAITAGRTGSLALRRLPCRDAPVREATGVKAVPAAEPRPS